MAKWRRLRRIALAGQAEIWLVKDEETSRQAVMKKLLRTAQLPDPDAELRRFHREIRCQMTMDHPRIMPIIGVNFKSDPPFYVMPLAERTLQEEIDSLPGGLGTDDAAGIMLDIVDAIVYAHEQGILHRDLKPANVMMVDGLWLVGDFGLCRDLASESTTFTQTNTIVGTIAYMAPEQFDDGHSAGATADVYALGRMFYHMLTGRRPFPYAPLEQLPAEYRYLVSKAMADEPVARYASVAEFGQQIELILGRADGLASPTERGTALLNQVLNGDPEAVHTLVDIILSSSDDERFYTEFVSKLSEPALAALQDASPVAFATIIRTFDQYSEGSHPFNYVDVVADFFARVFNIAEDPLIRQMALSRIMIIGESHNRFYVGGVFSRLVAGLADPHDILLAVNVMRNDRPCARWYKDYLEGVRSLPYEIRSILSDVG